MILFYNGLLFNTVVFNHLKATGHSIAENIPKDYNPDMKANESSKANKKKKKTPSFQIRGNNTIVNHEENEDMIPREEDIHITSNDNDHSNGNKIDLKKKKKNAWMS